MNPTKELVRHILDNASMYTWTIQGLGMVRIYLTPDARIRLHIWHHDFKVPGVSDIHDHPWNFESHVVCGFIKNQKYIVNDPMIYNWLDAQPYDKVNILCGVGATPADTLTRESLHATTAQIYIPGMSYTQLSTEIHCTADHSDGAITLVERTFTSDPDHANVWMPTGTPFISAEPRNATAHEIALAISSARKQLDA